MGDVTAYASLFATAFVAATVLPSLSEGVLAGLMLTGHHPVALLVLFASLGNVAGSVVNWVIGRGVGRFAGKTWFPVSPDMLERASQWYRRYGRWTLLMSWVPVIGDPLTVAAGVLREPLWIFLVLVTIAKVSRYVAVAAITLNWA